MSVDKPITPGSEAKQDPPTGGTDPGPESPKSSATAIGLAFLFALGFLAAVPLSLWGLNAVTDDYSAEISLSVVLIAAAAALIIVVSMLAVAFNRLRIINAEQAMALPQGSIRAIIALLLIVLFFISAIYLYTTIAQGPTPGPARTLRGITAAQLATLPAADIDSVRTRRVRNATVYDVVLAGRLPDTQTSDDIAAQLITIVATLVTAVAAFYFGANSVNTAAATTASVITTTDQARTTAAEAAAKAAKKEAAEKEAAAKAAEKEKAAKEAAAEAAAKEKAHMEAAAHAAEKEKAAKEAAAKAAQEEAAAKGESQKLDQGPTAEEVGGHEAEAQGPEVEQPGAPTESTEPSDVEVAELESEDLTEAEIEAIERSRNEAPDVDDSEAN